MTCETQCHYLCKTFELYISSPGFQSWDYCVQMYFNLYTWGCLKIGVPMWVPQTFFLVKETDFGAPLFWHISCFVCMYFLYSTVSCNLPCGISCGILSFYSSTWVGINCLWNWMHVCWFLYTIVLKLLWFVSKKSCGFLLNFFWTSYAVLVNFLLLFFWILIELLQLFH